jgi:2-oxoglutarate dehydrogenase E2 component (dihydrolipoamide succinyltransferase)
MATSVVMPQMGESIAEGTIVRWIKKVGDQVDRDEPLFEISTDKVDAEIPSPAAGVLTEIKVHEGETVPVNAVVGTIGQPGDAGTTPEPPPAPATAGKVKAAAAVHEQPDGSSPSTASPATRKPNGHGAMTVDELRRQKSSPLVRKIARENNIDIRAIHGSGIGGRVTKDDILGYVSKSQSPKAKTHGTTEVEGTETPPPTQMRAPVVQPGERIDIQPLSVMRRKIAEHMVLSRRTSAHVHTVFHVNFAAVERIRQLRKSEYEQRGAKLTYMTFIAKAVIDAIRRHPTLNASLDGDNVIIKKDVNLGIAVALEDGLIVPVIRNADERNLLGLSRAIADVADRARAKQLKPEEVQGGTFTITNPGQFGAQFGLPIINQPQVAILCVGTVEKRPVVVDDAIAIRTMAYLTLGFDHRLIDGAMADSFMADIKKQIEHFDPSQV